MIRQAAATEPPRTFTREQLHVKETPRQIEEAYVLLDTLSATPYILQGLVRVHRDREQMKILYHNKFE